MRVGNKHYFLYLWVVVFSLALGSCVPVYTSPTAGPATRLVGASTTPSLTPFQPEGNLPTAAATPAAVPEQESATPITNTLWISPTTPDVLRQAALSSGLSLASAPDGATVHLDIVHSGVDPNPASVWIYALVTPFPTITDEVSLTDLKNTWAGNPSGPFAGRFLWIDAPTLAAFSTVWGMPAAGSVRVAEAGQLVEQVWNDRPAWAIVPFENLEPRWKVLSVDGQSPIHNDFDPSTYPLKVTFSLQPGVFALPQTNRDPSRLTVLAMTGVTALVRGTADRMEKKGILYPGEEVRSVLRAADLTHISNEIPFDPNCPAPDPWTESLIFCSDPRYIALLEDVGTDIVELTGNHLMDHGAQAALGTLDMYDNLGWKYFGGGSDLQRSLQPALVEHNGNKLAFLGCNYAGPSSDWATDTHPGSTPCDFETLSATLAQLRAQGYLPIMTFQYIEYYTAYATLEEQADFRQMAEAGAIIVSGSQSHVPAEMEFHAGSFVHYGLGNLFFDQMSHEMPDGSLIYDTRNLFIDRHIFYGGRYLGTELLTYIIEDYARPRLMTGVERSQFLQKIFAAAGW